MLRWDKTCLGRATHPEVRDCKLHYRCDVTSSMFTRTHSNGSPVCHTDVHGTGHSGTPGHGPETEVDPTNEGVPPRHKVHTSG